MSVTEGMSGDYDSHSEYQRRVLLTSSALIDRSIGDLRLPEPPEPLVITDLGAGTGQNSMTALGGAVVAARRRTANLPIVCVHADLPTNDWNALFSSVYTSPDSYLNAPGPPVLPMAVGRSFFESVVPPGLAHLQLSFSAAHWLRSQPTVDVDGFYFCEATGQARRDLAAQAAEDWLAFLGARASDLKPGGHLIVQCVGTDTGADGDELVTARELLAAMTGVAEEMADDGSLSHEAVQSYVLPVYARTVAEARAPLDSGGELAGEFDIVEVSTAPVPNPYLDRWKDDADADRYSQDYAGFVRGFTESSLRIGPLAPSAGDANHMELLVDEYFRRLEQRFAANPERDAFRDWTLTVVLTRR